MLEDVMLTILLDLLRQKVPRKHRDTLSSVQLLSRVRLFVTPWIIAHQASLSITHSRNSLKLTSIKSVMPSSHLILCCPLLLLPPIPPSIRVFSNESTLHIRWPKYWSFRFSISPSKEHQDWSPLGWTGWISLQSKGFSRVFSNTHEQYEKRYPGDDLIPEWGGCARQNHTVANGRCCR